MIEAEIHSLESNDFPDWEQFLEHAERDPYDAYGWFHVTIGTVGVQGGNDFQVCVSTPRAVGRAKQAGCVPGVLVDRFDAASVQAAVKEKVVSIQASTWEQLVDQLRTFMRWEYEGMSGS